MSIKEVSNDDVTDMFKVPSGDHSLRISMENLKLRDHQEEEYVSRNQYHLVRGWIYQLIDKEPSVGQADGAWNRMRSAEAQPDETKKLEQVNRRCRTLTEKGREYRISILDKKRSSLVSRIIRKSSEINDLIIHTRMQQLSRRNWYNLMISTSW